MNHEQPAFAFDRVPDNQSHASDPSSSQTPEAVAASTSEGNERYKKEIFKKHKAQFFTHFIRQLDIMIYLQLSILYYMDCSFLSFLARSMNQAFYFTPKPPGLNPIIVGQRPQIVAIFGLNLLSMAFHSAYLPPTAGEAVRGYLHGGVLIDFVGQKSPVPRIRLVFYDLLVLSLQLVILSITLGKDELGDPPALAVEGGQSRDEEAQTYDLEEQGIRSNEGVEGLELLPLQTLSGRRIDGDEDRERDELLQRTEGVADHPEDIFHSGQCVIADVPVVDTIRNHWKQSSTEETPNRSNGSLGAAAAAELTRRRLRFRIRLGGRDLGP
ncbi:MAG: hypothetical protein Q9220_001432 [cf. Caloplaca sp. 1 TL-2023]